MILPDIVRSSLLSQIFVYVDIVSYNFACVSGFRAHAHFAGRLFALPPLTSSTRQFHALPTFDDFALS